MQSRLFRHIVAVLLVLTLANLAASFIALRAVHSLHDQMLYNTQRIDTAVQKLDDALARLCERHPDTCVSAGSTFNTLLLPHSPMVMPSP